MVQTSEVLWSSFGREIARRSNTVLPLKSHPLTSGNRTIRGTEPFSFLLGRVPHWLSMGGEPFLMSAKWRGWKRVKSILS